MRTMHWLVASAAIAMGGIGCGAGDCEEVSTKLSCSKLEACCDSAGTACWYNATRNGSTKKFECSGVDCNSAAGVAVNFCK